VLTLEKVKSLVVVSSLAFAAMLAACTVADFLFTSAKILITVSFFWLRASNFCL
jgi:hypothetical protein